MAVESVFVLAIAAHVVAFRHDFAGVAHVEVFKRVPQSVVNHGIHDRAVSQPVSFARAGQQIRSVRHALHSARNNDFRIAALYPLRR